MLQKGASLNLTVRTIKVVWLELFYRLSGGVKVGQQAPNIKLLDMDKKPVRLLDYLTQGRLFVVNFGSCTWPPFIAKLAQYNQLVADFSREVDFLTVYVKEAHAADKWGLKNTFDYEINDHKNIDDRLQAAKMLQGMGTSCPLAVDTMTNEAAAVYGALPESLFVVEDGKVAFKALGPFAYDPMVLRKWLEEKIGKKK